MNWLKLNQDITITQNKFCNLYSLSVSVSLNIPTVSRNTEWIILKIYFKRNWNIFVSDYTKWNQVITIYMSNLIIENCYIRRCIEKRVKVLSEY